MASERVPSAIFAGMGMAIAASSMFGLPSRGHPRREPQPPKQTNRSKKAARKRQKAARAITRKARA